MSVWQNVGVPKCQSAKMSAAKMSFAKMLFAGLAVNPPSGSEHAHSNQHRHWYIKLRSRLIFTRMQTTEIIGLHEKQGSPKPRWSLTIICAVQQTYTLTHWLNEQSCFVSLFVVKMGQSKSPTDLDGVTCFPPPPVARVLVFFRSWQSKG